MGEMNSMKSILTGVAVSFVILALFWILKLFVFQPKLEENTYVAKWEQNITTQQNIKKKLKK